MKNPFNNFYITYYAKKYKKMITRKGRYDKPDGTPSLKGLYTDKSGQPVLNYWDLDADGWRNATGQMYLKIKKDV
jgi:hypothetical protein|tara:strand:+ start:336 stop:560 length:225 start_codon:yes stop_codon:yes gene_type:complete